MPVHAIAISPDLRQFLHIHGAFANAGGHGHGNHGGHQTAPATSGSGPLAVHAAFPAAGLYKLWIQVKRQDRVITAAIVVEVR